MIQTRRGFLSVLLAPLAAPLAKLPPLKEHTPAMDKLDEICRGITFADLEAGYNNCLFPTHFQEPGLIICDRSTFDQHWSKLKIPYDYEVFGIHTPSLAEVAWLV